MATYAVERARSHNRPSYILHVEGLPHLWFSRLPTNWTAPAGWTYEEGLALKPGSGAELSQDLDPLSGVEDASSIGLVCYADSFLAALSGDCQGVKGVERVLLASNNVDPNDDSDLVTDEALDAAPVGVILDDQFSDGLRTGWSDTPGLGTIAEAGGKLSVAAALNNSCYWQAGNHNGPRATVDMTTIRSTAAALFCAEFSADFSGSAYAYSAQGVGVMEDESNAWLWAARGSDGAVFRRKAVADVWSDGSHCAGTGRSGLLGRLYWNTAGKTVSGLPNGDTLPDDYVAMYVSRDAGATWTAVEAAAPLECEPDYIVVYAASSAAGEGTGAIDATYLTVTETDVDGGERLIHVGRQTVSYTKRDGVTFSGVDRGRYHSLDGDLLEVKYKPELRWSAKLDAAPKVTTYPRVALGRSCTLYRIYLDEDGAGPTDKSQHGIRFRGTIDAVGDGEDHLGLEIKATSIVDLLDAPIFSLPAEAELRGYNMGPYPQARQGVLNREIHLRESFWYLPAIAADQYVDRSEEKDHLIDIGSASYYETPDELVKAINDALDTAYKAGNTFAPYRIQRGPGGLFEIGYEAVGHTSFVSGALAKGSTGTFNYGVYGELIGNDISTALGFDANDKALPICGVDGTKYRDLFARWTNPAHFAAYLISGDKYRRLSVRADNKASRAWMRLNCATGIPAEFDSAHEFVETPGDGSPFLINVADTLIYQCGAADSVSQEISLDPSAGGAMAQYQAHLGAHVRPEDPILAIEEGSDNSDRPVARQVWMPSCKTSLTLSGSTTAYMMGIEQLLLQAMLSTGEGAGYNSAWDLLPADWALGIPSGFVDTDSFEALADSYGHASRQRRYVFTEPRNFRELCESEAQTLGFMIVMREGKIAAVPRQEACASNAVATLDDDARAVGDVGWQTAPEGIVNAITIHHDCDVMDGDFYRHLELKDVASATDHGRVQELTIENHGVRGKDWRPYKKNATTVDDIEQLLWDRMNGWSSETYLYTCPVNRSVDNLCVGDVVLVTDARVPNPLTGTRGIVGHPGTVQSMAMADHDCEGEVTVRINYSILNTIVTVSAMPLMGSGVMAQSGALTGGGQGNTIDVDLTALQPNSSANGYATGDLVQVQDIETGEAWQRTVTGWDAALGRITMDAAVGFDATDGHDRVVTWTNAARAAAGSVSGNELQAAHLANSSGEVLGVEGWHFL